MHELTLSQRIALEGVMEKLATLQEQAATLTQQKDALLREVAERLGLPADEILVHVKQGVVEHIPTVTTKPTEEPDELDVAVTEIRESPRANSDD